MSPIEACALDFEYISQKLHVTEGTAALLVLAASVEHASPFSEKNSERFGHELALALKHVLEAEIKVTLSGDIFTEGRK